VVEIGDFRNQEVSAIEEQLAEDYRERNRCMEVRCWRECRKKDKLGMKSLNLKTLNCRSLGRVREARQGGMRNNLEDLQMSSKGWSSEELERGGQTLT